jgi:hypothetical protein
MFQYASIFEKGRRIVPRSLEPKGKTEDSYSGQSFQLKRANLEKIILPADASQKGEMMGI